MAVRELTLLLKARDEASRALRDAGDNAQKASVSFESVIKAAAMGGALSTMAGFMADISREAAADVAAMEAVRVATENSGTAWGDAEGEISAFIDNMRDSAAIADDTMKPALASLIAVTGDYGKSMELAALAADLARGKNISLEAAAQLVGKVAMGNTSALARYGIVLKDGATATEALGELQSRFAGQAEAYGNTTKGQLESLTHRIGDMRESLGGALGAMQPVFAMLPGMSAAWTALGGVIGGSTPKLIAQTAATVAHGIASGVGTVATGAMTLAQAALNAVMSANPIAIVVIALAALTAGIIYAYNNSEDFRAAVDKLGNLLKTVFAPAVEVGRAALEGLRAVWDWLSGNNTQTLDMDAGEVIDATNEASALQRAWEWFSYNARKTLEMVWENSQVKRAIDEMQVGWDWFASNATRTLEMAEAWGNTTVKNALEWFKENWEWFKNNATRVLDIAMGFGSDMVKTVVDGIKTVWDWLQKAGTVTLDIKAWGLDQIRGIIDAIKTAWEWLSRNATIFLNAMFSQSGNPPPGLGASAGATRITPVISTPSVGPFQAIGEYLNVVMREGDALNDWLTHIPGKYLQFKWLARYLGEVVTTGETVNEWLQRLPSGIQSLARYVGTVITEGDTLNDWLMDVPIGLRNFAKYLATVVTEGDTLNDFLNNRVSFRPGSPTTTSAVGGTNINITVSGNTILGSERSIAVELARILKPELDALANVSMSA